MNEKELIGLLLPEGIIDGFDIVKVEKSKEGLTLHLDEKHDPSLVGREEKLISKGFYEAVTVQDFPIRGKACYLKVRRRRWTVESTGEIISNDWNTVAKGTRMTKEFASFLKAISR